MREAEEEEGEKKKKGAGNCVKSQGETCHGEGYCSRLVLPPPSLLLRLVPLFPDVDEDADGPRLKEGPEQTPQGVLVEDGTEEATRMKRTKRQRARRLSLSTQGRAE